MRHRSDQCEQAFLGMAHKDEDVDHGRCPTLSFNFSLPRHCLRFSVGDALRPQAQRARSSAYVSLLPPLPPLSLTVPDSVRTRDREPRQPAAARATLPTRVPSRHQSANPPFSSQPSSCLLSSLYISPLLSSFRPPVSPTLPPPWATPTPTPTLSSRLSRLPTPSSPR